jgi:adenylate cyclase
MSRQIRLLSGSILFAYVLVHFTNHALGIVSLDAMESMLSVVYQVVSWRPVTCLLYGALVVHLALALYALWQRRSLALQPTEAMQYVLGFAVPLLVAQHVTDTRIDADYFGGDFGHYENLLSVFWYTDPLQGVLQIVLLLAVWIHSCIGYRFWLRWRPWYAEVQSYLFAFAIAVPLLAIAGDIAGGRQVGMLDAQQPGRIARTVAAEPAPENRAQLNAIAWTIRLVFLGSLGLVLAARLVRHHWWRRRGTALILYPDGRSIEVASGFTVLEASRMLGIPHASICGGKGRCSTCRIRVRVAQDTLPEPSWTELNVLRRIGSPPNVRLACQLRPRGPVEVTPLFLDSTHARESLLYPERVHGGESRIAVLFADLRDFTSLSESKLPYDTLFVLNRYFRAVGEAVETAGGHVDKFMGDGVMALFGLDTDPKTACRQALNAARLMSIHLVRLNDSLGSDLDSPLRMAIGIHFGPAIVGDMGYGKTRSLTAVGDTINVASGLERGSKLLGCELVVSEDFAAAAEVDLSEGTRQSVPVRGRSTPLPVLAFKSARDLPATVGVVSEKATGAGV